MWPDRLLSTRGNVRQFKRWCCLFVPSGQRSNFRSQQRGGNIKEAPHEWSSSPLLDDGHFGRSLKKYRNKNGSKKERGGKNAEFDKWKAIKIAQTLRLMAGNFQSVFSFPSRDRVNNFPLFATKIKPLPNETVGQKIRAGDSHRRWGDAMTYPTYMKEETYLLLRLPWWLAVGNVEKEFEKLSLLCGLTILYTWSVDVCFAMLE